MMKLFAFLITRFALLAVAGFSVILVAQDLPPQIQPLADKYKSDLAILESQRTAAVGRAQQVYVVALNAAENAALAASQLPVIAAITAERQAVTRDSMLAEFPRGLPTTLQVARKVYMDTVARIAAEVPTRREKLGVEYLRALNALQASADAELSTAIADEKMRVIADAKVVKVSTPPPAPVVPAKPAQDAPSGFVGFAKSLKEQAEIVPFAGETGTRKFKPNDKAVPDEFRVTIDNRQIRISGAKRTNVSEVESTLIAHYGKLVLISAPAPQSGTLITKIPTGREAPHYGLALELTNGKLKSIGTSLDVTSYDWSVKVEGADFIFEMTKNNKTVNSIKAAAAEVKAFGFTATGRSPGHKVDLTVDVNPSAKIR